MAHQDNESRISAVAPRLAIDSIVDLLLSLPDEKSSESDAVDRAVAGRLQTELANRMRLLIGNDNHRQAA